MQKELIISTTPQETKIAILEDDELVEYYIERHRSQGIVGNIYKGKVTKVLPGMQSAFVDIGLERDAFLYVSDFFEDTEEYDKIVSTVEDEVAQLQETGRGKPAAAAVTPVPVAAPLPPPVVIPAPVAEPEATPEPQVVSGIQPLPGETLGEGDRQQAATAGSPGPAARRLLTILTAVLERAEAVVTATGIETDGTVAGAKSQRFRLSKANHSNRGRTSAATAAASRRYPVNRSRDFLAVRTRTRGLRHRRKRHRK